MSHLYPYTAEWGGQRCTNKNTMSVINKQMLTFTQNQQSSPLTGPTHSTQLGEVIIRKCSCCRQSQGCWLCYSLQCSSAGWLPYHAHKQWETNMPFVLSLFLAGSLFSSLSCSSLPRRSVFLPLSWYSSSFSHLCLSLLRSQFFNQIMKRLQRLAEQSPPHCSSEVLMWKEGDDEVVEVREEGEIKRRENRM